MVQGSWAAIVGKQISNDTITAGKIATRAKPISTPFTDVHEATSTAQDAKAARRQRLLQEALKSRVNAVTGT